MTQQELADTAGVDLKTVYNLESGTRWPIARTRAAISAALRWEGDALTGLAESARLRGTETPPPPATPEGAAPADAEVNAQVLSLLFRRAERPVEAEVRDEIRAAKAAYRGVSPERIPEAGTEFDAESGAESGDSGLPGAAIPTFDAYERAIWDLAVTFTEEERARRIIDARAAAAARQSGRARRAGLKRPDVLTA